MATDPAHDATDEEIRRLSKRLHAAYSRAYREMAEKAKADLESQAEADREMAAKVKAGEMTADQLSAWRRGRAADATWYAQMVNQLARQMAECDRQAAAIVNGASPAVYAENANYGAFQVEEAAKVDTSWTLVDADTVATLVRDHPDLLPRVSPEPSKAEAWARRKITSAITQSVLVGESVPAAARRLRSVVDMGERAATRAARTALTGAENAGRVSSYDRARGMGIDVRARWMATLDSRTRDSHRKLDGEVAGDDGKFSNGLRYPGDPTGPASEVWNCRCTLVASMPGYDAFEDRNASKLETSYEDWKAGRDPKRAKPSGKGAGIDPEARVYEVLDKRQARVVDEALRRAPDSLSRLYKRHEHEFKTPAVNAGNGAWYSPAEDRVTINPGREFDPSGRREPGNTWFHEFGHNIDHIEAPSGRSWSTLSFEYGNGAFPAKLREEARAYCVKAKGEMTQWATSKIDGSDDGEAYLRGGLADELRSMGLISGDVAHDYKWNRIGKEDLKASLKKPTLTGAYKYVAERLAELPDKERADVSDLLGGATNMRCREGWGHFGKGYWDKEGRHLSTEAFAEMSAASFTSPESLGIIREIFPESYEMFLKMTREAAGL